MSEEIGLDAVQIRDRIQYMLNVLEMKSSAFADGCELPRATVSNILNGKSNVTLEVLNKIIRTFPDWSHAWLLFGTGPMQHLAHEEQSLFSTEELDQGMRQESRNPDHSTDLFQKSQPSGVEKKREKDAVATQSETTSPPTIVIQQPTKAIEKIIVFYTDSSYQTFMPSDMGETGQ